MIIQMIQPKNSPRGRVGHVIDYIFDVDSAGRAVGKKRRDEVRFVGASASLCCADPFHPLTDKAKSELKHRIDLTDIKNAFETIELKNQRVKETTKHIVFSLKEGESLTPSQWYEMIKFYLEGMGYKNNLWLAVTHHNTKFEHAHVLLSCIENTAPYRKTKDSHNFAKSAKLRNELEKMFGLEADHNPFVSDTTGKRVSNSHFKTKVQCVREQIDKSLAQNNPKLTLPDFIDNLAFQGVGCHVSVENEDVRGVSFSLGKECFQGAALGFGYSWPELKRRGIEYRPENDLRRLSYRNKREESITKLIRHANRDHGFMDNYDIAETHNLIVTSDDFTSLPDSSKKHKFWVFRLFTPEAQLVDATQSSGQRQLLKLLQLRKNLASLYDFVFLKGRAAVQTFTESFLSFGSSLEFLQEVSATNWLFDKLISQQRNQVCLRETGFLLIAEKYQTNGDGSSAQYELDTAATRQNSTAIAEAESFINPAGVTVLGDYHDLLVPDSESADPVLPIQNLSEIAVLSDKRVQSNPPKAIRKLYRRPSDDGFGY